MVKLGTASPWLWRWLVAAVNLSASFVGADQLGGTVIPGAFLVEYEDNVVSFAHMEKAGGRWSLRSWCGQTQLVMWHTIHSASVV